MNIVDLQSEPAAFRAALKIDTDSGPQPFSRRVDPWQQRDFIALDYGWKAAIGQQPTLKQYCKRAWLERGRGHSKSSDIMIMGTWALFAAQANIGHRRCRRPRSGWNRPRSRRPVDIGQSVARQHPRRYRLAHHEQTHGQHARNY